MKLIKDNYGDIDLAMVQDWRTGHYFYDLDGIKHDTVWVDGYGDVLTHLAPGVATICRHRREDPGVDSFKGINTYVSIAVAEYLAIYRTNGRPCEWVGPWDAMSLYNIP